MAEVVLKLDVAPTALEHVHAAIHREAGFMLDVGLILSYEISAGPPRPAK